MSVYIYYNWTADQYRPVKLQWQLILFLYCVSHQLEMYINVSLYLLQLNSWPVQTSKATVTANTFIVLCVPPVRNVHKCQSMLITTEQLTSTDQKSYSDS